MLRKKKAIAAGINCFSSPSVAFLKYVAAISSIITAEIGIRADERAGNTNGTKRAIFPFFGT